MATSFCLLEIAHFVPVHEKCCLKQTHNGCNFWTMLAMELQKAAEDNQNKNINNSISWFYSVTKTIILPFFRGSPIKQVIRDS